MPIHLPAAGRLGDRLAVFRPGESFVTVGGGSPSGGELVCATPAADGAHVELRRPVATFPAERGPAARAPACWVDVRQVGALVADGVYPPSTLLLCGWRLGGGGPGSSLDLAAVLKHAASGLEAARAARYRNLVLFTPPSLHVGPRDFAIGELVEALGLLGAIVGVDVVGVPAGEQSRLALAGLYGGAAIVRCDRAANLAAELPGRLDSTKLRRADYPPALL